MRPGLPHEDERYSPLCQEGNEGEGIQREIVEI